MKKYQIENDYSDNRMTELQLFTSLQKSMGF